MKPLNGTKTHPLSATALRELKAICENPAPCSTVNPGAINRLARESLVAVKRMPSPYKTHKGRNIAHLVATEAGRKRAAES